MGRFGIRVKHHARWLKECKVKTYKITDLADIRGRIRLPRYKNPGSWKESSNAWLEVLDFYQVSENEKKQIAKLVKLGVEPGFTIATFEDDSVIVDGVHRALALRDGIMKFPATITEYTGEMVPRVFCVEFMSVMLGYRDN